MRLALALVACLVCAGCGSTRSHSASTPQMWSPPASGASVFAHNCQSCHTLIGNESAHKQGGDLLGYHMTRAQILTFTKVMPTRPLNAAQLHAVVDYVWGAQRHARR